MQSLFTKALSSSVSNHIPLSQTRRETLCWLAFLVMRHGTVCLWRLAAHVSTAAQTDSVRRRFYRFFQFVRLDGAAAARIVVDLLGLGGKAWVLAIDRTNWEFGRTTINILMISVIWNGVGIPLIWSLLPTAGNSDTATRICLLGRLRKAFPHLKIAALTGDREFVGEAWMAHLHEMRIPFVLRLRENQHVVREGYEPMAIAALARSLKRGQKMTVKGWCRLGQKADVASPAIRLVIMRLPSGELLALACSGRPARALAAYRSRWTIEILFGNLKTKGFNLEDTRLTNPDKLSTLLAVLALAVALAVKTGIAAARLKSIQVKKHGRKACSLFALGLHALRKIFAGTGDTQIIAFLRQLASSKMPLKPLQHMALGRGV